MLAGWEAHTLRQAPWVWCWNDVSASSDGLDDDDEYSLGGSLSVVAGVLLLVPRIVVSVY